MNRRLRRNLWLSGLSLTLFASGCDSLGNKPEKEKTEKTAQQKPEKKKTEQELIAESAIKAIKPKKSFLHWNANSAGLSGGAQAKGKKDDTTKSEPQLTGITVIRENAQEQDLAFAEALLAAPPISGENPQLEAELKRGGKDLGSNLTRLEVVAKSPSPADKSFLIELAEQDWQPLAPRALYLLRHYQDKETALFLAARLKSAQGEVRAPALASLGAVDREQGRIKAAELLSDPHTGVRITAALMLGTFANPKDQDVLRRTLTAGSPACGVYAAWALIRCGGGDEGLAYLRSLSRLNNPAFAVQAMRLLSSQRDPETIRLLFDNLYSRWNAVKEAAAQTLAHITQPQRESAVAGYVPERRQALELRLGLLLYRQGQGEIPVGYEALLDSESLEDRLLALECMQKRKTPADLPVLIPLLADAAQPVRERALLTMRELVRDTGLPEGPELREGHAAAAEWCRWWMRQYQVLAAAENRALVRDPLGATKEVERGDHLAFRSEVKAIRPGAGHDRRTGAAVELDCAGAPVVIQP